MPTFAFSKKTFSYFDGARENSGSREWFDAHREQYEEHVEVPFTHLVAELKHALAPLLPGIDFVPRKISKPLNRVPKDGPKASGPLLRENCYAAFMEKATSMFEQNPAVYISLGIKPDDNIVGCGLYMPSSRQMKELRPRFYLQHDEVTALLKDRKLRKHWDGLSGTRYTRFPKDQDETAPGAEFLWYKNWLLSRHPTRDEVIAPDFIPKTVAAFQAAVPFLTWTRKAVGVYKPPPGGYKRREMD